VLRSRDLARAPRPILSDLGAIGDDAGRAHGWLRDHGVVFFVLGPPLVSMAIGYAIYGVRRRRR
jgi:hypothetical protein